MPEINNEKDVLNLFKMHSQKKQILVFVNFEQIMKTDC